MPFKIVEKRLPWGSTKYGHDYGVLEAFYRNNPDLVIETREMGEQLCARLVEGVDAAFLRAIGPEGRSKTLGAPDRYVLLEVEASAPVAEPLILGAPA